MNPTDRRLFLPYLFLLLAVLSRSALAQLPDIVGTWERADATRMELTPQRTILEDAKVVGRWRPQEHGEGYILTWKRTQLNGDLDPYKRRLTVVEVGKTKRTTIERVDDGPTRNPDVPDRDTGWKMELADLTAGIARTKEEIARLEKESEELYAKHKEVRARGEISSYSAQAWRKKHTAHQMKPRVPEMEARIREIRGAMVKAARQPDPRPPAAAAATAPPPDSDPLTGRWDWMGDEILTLRADGTGSNEAFPGLPVTWKFLGVHRGSRTYVVTQGDGKFSDTITLSADAGSAEGRGKDGGWVSCRRVTGR